MITGNIYFNSTNTAIPNTMHITILMIK